MKRKTVWRGLVLLLLLLWGPLVLKVLGPIAAWSWWQATAPLWCMALLIALLALCLVCDRGLRWVDKVSA